MVCFILIEGHLDRCGSHGGRIAYKCVLYGEPRSGERDQTRESDNNDNGFSGCSHLGERSGSVTPRQTRLECNEDAFAGFTASGLLD